MMERQRVVVLGGTGFVGRAIVRKLVATGYDVTVVHRGELEPTDEPPMAKHVHASREDWGAAWPHLRGSSPVVLVDVAAYSRRDAEIVARPLLHDRDARLIVLSSMDVYAAWESFLEENKGTERPLTEDAPLRTNRYIYRERSPDTFDYEKLDVEEVYAEVGATVLRLPMVYGEHDDQRREGFILRRCEASRTRIPFGDGALKWSRLYVDDVGEAVHVAVSRSLIGKTYNVSEEATWSICEWAQRILEASGCDAELVRVPDDALPSDLQLSGHVDGDLLLDGAIFANDSGWQETDPLEALRRSVAWHQANPPADSGDFADDDKALRLAESD